MGAPKYDVIKGKATEIEVAPIPESIKAILVVRKISILNLHRRLRFTKSEPPSLARRPLQAVNSPINIVAYIFKKIPKAVF